MSARALVAFGATAVVALSCGSGTGEAPGTISGTITYSGAAAGGGRPLSLAVYTSFPPSGPPVTIQLLEQYEFPYHYVFSGLRPGVYFIGAAIDVDRMDTPHAGMLNARRDPYGYAALGSPIRIDALRGRADADIVLEDPR